MMNPFVLSLPKDELGTPPASVIRDVVRGAAQDVTERGML